MNAVELMQRAYVDDLIDVGTLEEFVGALSEGKMVVLPYHVQVAYYVEPERHWSPDPLAARVLARMFARGRRARP